jgi:hypothetical protein
LLERKTRLLLLFRRQVGLLNQFQVLFPNIVACLDALAHQVAMRRKTLVEVPILIRLHEVKNRLCAADQASAVLTRFRIRLDPSDDVDELDACVLNSCMCKEVRSQLQRSVLILVPDVEKDASRRLQAAHALLEHLQQVLDIGFETGLVSKVAYAVVALLVVWGAGNHRVQAGVRQLPHEFTAVAFHD